MVEEMADSLRTIGSEHLEQLLEISTTLSSTLDLKQLLQMVSSTATTLTDTEASSILLVEPTTGRLHFVAAAGMNAPSSETVVPLEGSIAGWIVQNGQSVVLDDVQRDTRHYTGIDDRTQFVTRNMLGVPLTTKGRVIGALEVINKRGQQAYSQQDLALMQALASQAAVAIENARLFQQTDLIAEFMHELKTPLMALTAASELLLRQDTVADRQDLLLMLQRETARLSKLAQDFLELARLESGRTHLICEPVDLASLITEVITLEKPTAARRQVTIEADLPATLPTIVGDYDRLKQVILNLTSNAIKYNQIGGRVVIRIWPVAAGDPEHEVVIEVADTGLGIAADNLAHLFDRFYRVPDKEGFSEGSGLGLAIARRVVEEHGGRITVSSEPGRGSSFCCRFPVVYTSLIESP